MSAHVERVDIVVSVKETFTLMYRERKGVEGNRTGDLEKGNNVLAHL